MKFYKIVVVLLLLFGGELGAQTYVTLPGGQCASYSSWDGNYNKDFPAVICTSSFTQTIGRNSMDQYYIFPTKRFFKVELDGVTQGSISSVPISSSNTTYNVDLMVQVFKFPNLNTPLYSSILPANSPAGVALPFGNSNYPSFTAGEYLIGVFLYSNGMIGMNGYGGRGNTIGLNFSGNPTCSIPSSETVYSCGPYYWDKNNTYYHSAGTYYFGNEELILIMPSPYCIDISYDNDLPYCIGVNMPGGGANGAFNSNGFLNCLSGVNGGVYSLDVASVAAGIVIDPNNGEIDFSNYTPVFGQAIEVTCTIGAPCPASDTEVLIVNYGDPTFSFSEWEYCNTDPDPVPTVATPGGVFVSLSGALQVDPNTGVIDVSASTPGTHLLHHYVGTGKGCETSVGLEITITNCGRLKLAANVSATTDCGGNLGSATVWGNGGSPPYSYLWSTGGNSGVENNLNGGQTYSVTVTDNNGDLVIKTITVPYSPILSLDIYGQDNLCHGFVNGEVTVDAISGTPPYSYLWSNYATGSSIANLPEGVYSITVTDNLGCTQTGTYSLVDPDLLFGYSTYQNVTSAGGSDGQISTFVTGGTGSYSYAWSNGSSTQNIVNLVMGNYTVTVTDDNNCTVILEENILENAALDANVSVITPIDCNGGNTGAISSFPIGGSAPFTYSWFNGTTTPEITNLIAGTYTVTVTDALGVTSSQTFNITEPSPLIVSANVNAHASGPGVADGSASATATGGTAPYTYVWSNGTTTSNNTGLNAQNYSVTVTDANGCTSDITVTISAVASLVCTISGSDVDCFAGNTGSANAAVTGGTSPYTYVWSANALNATTANINNLFAGTYSVTITDVNGLTTSNSLVITQPAELIVNTTVVAIESIIGNDGEVSASASGGTMPYSYAWSNGGVGSNIAGLTANTYTVTVSDNKGRCTADGQVVLISALSCNISGANVNCFAGNTGVANAAVSGGTPPYTYVWSANALSATTANISNLIAGTYSVTVTDANGLTTNNSVVITEPLEIIVNASMSSSVSINGGSDGSATASSSGGTGGITYQWSTGATGALINNLTSGVYYVTATDGNGCTSSTNVSISEPGALNVIISGTDINCNGQSTGAASTTVSGGVAPFTYSWSNNHTSDNLNSINAGTYTVTVTDANSATTSASINIGQSSAITITSQNITNVSCKGNDNGAIAVNVSGGQSPYSYLWSNGDLTQDISGLLPGYYSLTVTDNLGCTQVYSESITEPTDPEYSTQTVNSCGNYTWIDGITYTENNNTAQFTITNSLGCEELVTLNLTVDKVVISNSIQACDSYFWGVNNTTYDQNGTYTFLDQNTCEEYVLHLSILPTQNQVITITECEEFYWDVTGQTYTASTIVSEVVNVGGQCISYTLNLTIEIDEVITTTHANCGPFLWTKNGVTYSTSTVAVYYENNPTNNTCKKYVLNLTVNPRPVTFLTVTACHSYTWTANGDTYTSSGTYTYTAPGWQCNPTETLYLTILPMQDSTIVLTETGSYFWAFSNTTYTSSGIYTFTINNGGCPVEVTLDLTIISDPNPPTPVSSEDCETCIGSFSPIPGEKYVISAWVKERNVSAMMSRYVNPGIIVLGDATILGSFWTEGLIIDGWQKIEGEFTIPMGTQKLHLDLRSNGADVLFDDIRVYPFDASMKSFVYDPITAKLNAVLDELNYATFYEYDAEGNLVRIKKETERGIMTIQETRSNTSQ